jgi:hypothetical protein
MLWQELSDTLGIRFGRESMHDCEWRSQIEPQQRTQSAGSLVCDP